MAKAIKVTATWRSIHIVEVPDDQIITGNLSDLGEALWEIEPSNAVLVDWEFREVI